MKVGKWLLFMVYLFCPHRHLLAHCFFPYSQDKYRWEYKKRPVACVRYEKVRRDFVPLYWKWQQQQKAEEKNRMWAFMTVSTTSLQCEKEYGIQFSENRPTRQNKSRSAARWTLNKLDKDIQDISRLSFEICTILFQFIYARFAISRIRLPSSSFDTQGSFSSLCLSLLRIVFA